jgi:hypothetical protein
VYQVQPVIHLNQFIKNEPFTIGWNQDIKFYKTLKLELNIIHKLTVDYSLEFNVELFKINE